MRRELLYILSTLFTVESYRPVVLVHGILSTGNGISDLKTLILKSHPGTEVIILDYAQYDFETFVQMPIQLDVVVKLIRPIMQKHRDGIHLVCHSQGGLLCLGLLEYINDHNVHSFISLSTPLFGQYGLPNILLEKVPILQSLKYLSRSIVTSVMYTPLFQRVVSIANYWRDPRLSQQKQYEEMSIYLPKILNDPNAEGYREKDALIRKKNFLKLKRLVLVGGPHDGVIIPWQSSIFGYYDNRYTDQTKDIFEQDIYRDDWIGLKELYDSSTLKIYVFENIKHTDWHGDANVFQTAIIPWLD